MTETTIYTCLCGSLEDGPHCEWTGSLDELVLVEYMPAYLRSSHAAAHNSGAYPVNGAIRAAIHTECADRIEEYEGNDFPDGCTWFRRLDSSPKRLRFYAEEHC